MTRAGLAALLALASLLGQPAASLGAQAHAGHEHGDMDQHPWSLGAQAVGVVTRAAPALGGRDFTEGYLTQPMLMAHLQTRDGALALLTTLDGEGLTLTRGELTPGIYGEGYVDRRHPHTYIHELMGSGTLRVRGALASLSAGKGFAPFGTDDPMVRPFVKYPANHHLAQILERAVLTGAVRGGPATIELGLFNGDEPQSPSDPPNWDRFGDSWSARATLAGPPGVELQGSHAWVASPELAPGGGADQSKWSASARLERGARLAGHHRYALVEWARTTESVHGRPSFRFDSVLGEAAAGWRGAELALRYERTVRPEEERLRDPFRTARPHTDASILGRTRWSILTAHVGARVNAGGRLDAEPFIEVAHASAAEVDTPSAFVPAAFYGSDRQWSLSAGMRLAVGARHQRMGRYGAATSGHQMQ